MNDFITANNTLWYIIKKKINKEGPERLLTQLEILFLESKIQKMDRSEIGKIMNINAQRTKSQNNNIARRIISESHGLLRVISKRVRKINIHQHPLCTTTHLD